jgi:hypothetical protein
MDSMPAFQAHVSNQTGIKYVFHSLEERNTCPGTISDVNECLTFPKHCPNVIDTSIFRCTHCLSSPELALINDYATESRLPEESTEPLQFREAQFAF